MTTIMEKPQVRNRVEAIQTARRILIEAAGEDRCVSDMIVLRSTRAQQRLAPTQSTMMQACNP
jgi:hypothetical protein